MTAIYNIFGIVPYGYSLIRKRNRLTGRIRTRIVRN